MMSINVFARNLHDLLMAAAWPARHNERARCGLRTGVKSRR